ncbi:MAG: phosphatase PAP2 family protein [Pedosphaera sp.]|nr:phosphatase PAP2 family protein [Pedosphaera sp.]
MSRLRFVDLVTLIYLGFVTLILLGAQQSASRYWVGWLALHLALAAGILWLNRKPPNRFFDWIRELYCFPLLLLLYRESESLNHAIFTQTLDPWFLQHELLWFGIQPSFAFVEWIPNTFFAELLYAAYFSFYLMILGMGLWLIKRDRPAAHRFLGTLAAVFYSCYAMFILLPVVGPRILDLGGLSVEVLTSLELTTVKPMPASSQAGPFAHLMAFLYTWFEGQGGAFPSSHVLIACLVLREAFRQKLRIRWIQCLAVVLLCLGTVYGRYHYLIDVIAGLLLACPLSAVAEWAQNQMDKRAQPTR